MMHPKFQAGRITYQMKYTRQALALGLALAIVGCGRNAPPQTLESKTQPAAPVEQALAFDPVTLMLMPQVGDSRTDKEIRRYQDKVRQGENLDTSVEKLGWLFIAKARESFDPGYYKLAAVCADVLETNTPGCSQALLLHGYVLENLHRFKEAEPLARQLTTTRGLPFDFGLLGDSLMEQGKLDAAVKAYQSMVDLRPDLESYARVAHIRWLKGDTEGAVEMMRAAVSASSPHDPDSAAWANTRLAMLEFQSGKTDGAQTAATAALEVRPNYPPALLLRGRMFLAENDFEQAVATLATAVKANPLPEYQWALAEALRAADREPEATDLESNLREAGAGNDPRTFSLFLATRGEDTATALRLAETELQQRQDVFTQDALAWALAANGQTAEARKHMALAMAENTDDARLFFHAAVIAHQAEEDDEAQKWFARAVGSLQTLLPSERQRLMQLAENFPTDSQTNLMGTAASSHGSSLTAGK